MGREGVSRTRTRPGCPPQVTPPPSGTRIDTNAEVDGTKRRRNARVCAVPPHTRGQPSRGPTRTDGGVGPGKATASPRGRTGEGARPAPPILRFRKPAAAGPWAGGYPPPAFV